MKIRLRFFYFQPYIVHETPLTSDGSAKRKQVEYDCYSVIANKEISKQQTLNISKSSSQDDMKGKNCFNLYSICSYKWHSWKRFCDSKKFQTENQLVQSQKELQYILCDICV